LSIDRDPSRPPAATQLRTAITLRNLNQPPTVVLNCAAVGSGQAVCDSLGTNDPDGQALTYVWSYATASCTPAPATRITPPTPASAPATSPCLPTTAGAATTATTCPVPTGISSSFTSKDYNATSGCVYAPWQTTIQDDDPAYGGTQYYDPVNMKPGAHPAVPY